MNLKLLILQSYFYSKLRTNRQILKLKSALFHRLLKHAYNHSKFYKDFYHSHGIREKDLQDISISDLPFTDKTMILDNINNVFTDSNLKIGAIEQWLLKNPDPRSLYQNKYYVINTSGSSKSGQVGVFVYGKSDFEKAFALATAYLSSRMVTFQKKRFLYIGAVEHSAGATMNAALANSGIPVKFIKVNEDLEKHIPMINEFRPNFIVGYPSAVAKLLQFSKNKTLNIKLLALSTSGEILTDATREAIRTAFNVEPTDTYASTEGLVMGYKKSSHDLIKIIEENIWLEVINEQGEIVKPGGQGYTVITNFCSHVTPIIRYKLNDAVLTSSIPEYQGRYIEKIRGREFVFLPILTDLGKEIEINIGFITGWPLSGLQQMQMQLSHHAIDFLYVGKNNINSIIQDKMQKLLLESGASKTNLTVHRVDYLEPNKTGKVPLVSYKV